MNISHITFQRDSMQCGIACLVNICNLFGKEYTIEDLYTFCHISNNGISFSGLKDAANAIGLSAMCIKCNISKLLSLESPCILHWNQNHFVVLYKTDQHKGLFYIIDPAKGKIVYSLEDFSNHWCCLSHYSSIYGFALVIERTIDFGRIAETKSNKKNSFRFIFSYLNNYKRLFIQIFIGLLLGCILQLIIPFMTQSIVDLGILHRNIDFVWLVLIGELMLIIGKTATDFIRRWLLLHISMRINISLVSDFFIKLLKLPMSFFDVKLTGDLLQRIADHSRVESFLTKQIINLLFTSTNFIIFGFVLYLYNTGIFIIFLIGALIYGFWIVLFLKRRKIIDYETFEIQAINQNKTYQFITSMQEIKLQDCERRRRWEWEDTQADLFNVQMKSLKLQQTQEAGSIFINEIKNILITVFAATAVINGQMTLGAMLAVQYIIGQLNSPVEQFMSFIYSLQDVKISLERINEIHEGKNEETNENQVSEFHDTKSIKLTNVVFKYDPHALRKTLTDVSFDIPEGRVTAIVGASGSGKTTLIKLMLGYYP